MDAGHEGCCESPKRTLRCVEVGRHNYLLNWCLFLKQLEHSLGLLVQMWIAFGVTVVVALFHSVGVKKL